MKQQQHFSAAAAAAAPPPPLRTAATTAAAVAAAGEREGSAAGKGGCCEERAKEERNVFFLPREAQRDEQEEHVEAASLRRRDQAKGASAAERRENVQVATGEEKEGEGGAGAPTNEQEKTANPKEGKKKEKRVVALFDLDGTLTPPRQPMEEDMCLLLRDVKKKKSPELALAVVSGSDENKIREQLRVPDLFDLVDFVFCENGCVAYKRGKLLQQRSLAKELGEENLKKVVNFALRYIADLDIPIKRGTFVEYRHGLLNLSPIGRNCSREERNAFAHLDEKEKIRERMQQVMQREFAESLNLQFSLGGQISVDCFPKGWDKRLCLSFLEDYEEIHFFGDKTEPGGNDYEVFQDARVIGHAVTGPAETMHLLRQLFL